MTATQLTVPRPVTDEAAAAISILSEVRRAGFTTVGQITAATYIDIFHIARVLRTAVEAGIVEQDGAAYMWVEQVAGEVEDHGNAVHDHTLGTTAILQDSFGRKFVARLEADYNNGPGTAVNHVWFPALPEERSEYFVGVLGTVVAVLHAPDEDDPRYTAEGVSRRITGPAAPVPEDRLTARQREASAEIESRELPHLLGYPAGTVATIRDTVGRVEWRVMECFIREDGHETWCWTPRWDEPGIPKRVSGGSVLEVFHRPDANDPAHIHIEPAS